MRQQKNDKALRLPPCACPLAPVPDHSPGPHQESCTQYNALKLNAELFGRAPHAELADAFERKLLNGVMGIQRPHKPGALLHRCNTRRPRLQPHAPHAATPRTAGCVPCGPPRGSQPRTEYAGAMLYMMPLGRGVSKPKANWAGK